MTASRRATALLFVLPLLSVATVSCSYAYSPHLLWTHQLGHGQTAKGQGGWLVLQPSGSIAEGYFPPGVVAPWAEDKVLDPTDPAESPVAGHPWELLVLHPETGATALRLHGCYTRYMASGTTFLAARTVDSTSKMVVEVWGLETGTLRAQVPAVCADPLMLPLSEVTDGRFYFADDNGKHLYDLRRQAVTRSWAWHNYGSSSAGDPERWLFGLLPVGDRFYYGDGHTIGIHRMSDSGGWYYYCDTDPVLADEHGVIGIGGYKRGIISLDPAGKPYFVAREPDSRTFWTVDDSVTPVFLAGRQIILGANLFRRIPPPAARRYDSDAHQQLSAYLVAFDRLTGKTVWKKPMAPASYATCGDRVAVMAGHRTPSACRYRLEVYDLSGRRLSRGRQVWDGAPPELLPAGKQFAISTGQELRCYR